MAGPKIIPKGSRFWPAQQSALRTAEIIRMYESGFAGAYDEPEERERLREEAMYAQGADAAHAMGWAGSGEGQLSIPFVHVLDLWPGCLPGPGQDRGDCVSHDTKNAALLTLACEIIAGEPDEETGLVEGPPEVSGVGIANGVLSTEAIYWWRRHGGDGWSCPAAARVVQRESGLWVRQDYPELQIDLTEYSGRKAGLYGRQTPPEKVKQIGQAHLVREFTQLDTFEELCDFLANGYGISSCGGEGWESSRDKNGVSRRRGGWAHALAAIGADDRPVVKELYGEGLVLVQNSWSIWNRGGRDIVDSARFVPPHRRQEWIRKGIVNPETGNIMIPEGSYWALWSDFRRRYMCAFSSANGWPRKSLPNWGGSLAG